MKNTEKITMGGLDEIVAQLKRIEYKTKISFVDTIWQLEREKYYSKWGIDNSVEFTYD